MLPRNSVAPGAGIRSGSTQTERAPQRSAPRASAPRRSAPARRAPSAKQQRGERNGGDARRAAPRRAPRTSGSGRVEGAAPPANARGNRVTAPRGNRAGTAARRAGRPDSRVVTSGGDRRGHGTPRVVAPSRGGTTVGNRAGRTGGRNTRTGRADTSRQGATQVDRRPPGGRVVGTAVRRPPLSSRPIVVNNYGGRGYTSYRGRHQYGAHHIYGSSFYFPGYNTFNFRAPDMPFGPRRNDGVRLSLLSGAKDPKRGLQELKRRRKHLTFTPKYAEYITGRIMASQVIHGTSIPHALPSQSRGHGQRAPCRGSAGRTGHLL